MSIPYPGYFAPPVPFSRYSGPPSYGGYEYGTPAPRFGGNHSIRGRRTADGATDSRNGYYSRRRQDGLFAEASRIKKLILSAGDDLQDIPGYITTATEGHILEVVARHRSVVDDVLLRCVKAMPMKIGIYATWVALIAQKLNLRAVELQKARKSREGEGGSLQDCAAAAETHSVAHGGAEEESQSLMAVEKTETTELQNNTSATRTSGQDPSAAESVLETATDTTAATTTVGNDTAAIHDTGKSDSANVAVSTGVLTGKQFLQELLSKVAFQLEVHFKRGEYRETIMLIRFCCGLVGASVVKRESLFSLLDCIICSPIKTEEGEAPLAEHVDIPVFIVLSCLPWISRRDFESSKSRLSSYIDFGVNYVRRRQCPWKKAVEVIREPPEVIGPDRLDTLVEATKSMLNAGWQSKATFRFYQHAQLLPLLDDLAASNHSVSLPLPFVTVRGEDFAKMFHPVETMLRLPVTTDAVEKPLPPHDRWLLEDHVIALLNAFQSNAELCAQMLLRMPVPDTQLDYIIVETILSEMLRLPKRPDPMSSSDCNVFYFVLLQRLKQRETGFQMVVEKAVHSIVKRIVDFDDESFETLSEFLGYWLSACNCEWEFGSWLQVHKPAAPLIRFVRRTMENLVTLVWRDYVTHHVPAYVLEYIPPLCTADCEWIEGEGPVEFHMLRRLLKFNLDQGDEYRFYQQSRVACLVLSMLQHKRLLCCPQSYLEEGEDEASGNQTTQDSAPPGEMMPDGAWDADIDAIQNGQMRTVKMEVMEDDRAPEPPSKRRRNEESPAQPHEEVMQVDYADDEEDETAVGADSQRENGSSCTNHDGRPFADSESGRSVVDGGLASGAMSDAVTADFGTPSDAIEGAPSGSSAFQPPDAAMAEYSADAQRPGDQASSQQRGEMRKRAGNVSADSFREFQYAEETEVWTHQEVVDVFLKAVLSQGAKSDTHMNRLFENYGFVFMLLRPSYLYNTSLRWFSRYDVNASTATLRCSPCLHSEAFADKEFREVCGDSEGDSDAAMLQTEAVVNGEEGAEEQAKSTSNLESEDLSAERIEVEGPLDMQMTAVAGSSATVAKRTISDRAYYGNIVAKVYEFWSNSGQKICLCLERLLVEGLVPFDCVNDYALFAVQDDMLDELREWYIVRMVLREVVELQSTAEFLLKTHKRLLIKTEEQIDHLETTATKSVNRVQELVQHLLLSLTRKIENVPESNAQLRRHLLLRLLAYGRKFGAYICMEELRRELADRFGPNNPVTHAIDLIEIAQRYYKNTGAATAAERVLQSTPAGDSLQEPHTTPS